MATGEGNQPEDGSSTNGPRLLFAGGVVLLAAGIAAALLVDLILGAFAGIFGATLLVVSAMARDWDAHPSFEERELARARKRKEKWERGSAARARDRARWEAHQERRARKDGR